MLLEMSISNQVRTFRCGRVLCALLRDNIQHHLEGGIPSGAFPAIHALADAPWDSGPVSVSPVMLIFELEAAWPELRDLPTESLAISIRTRAIITHSRCPPEVHGTVLRRHVNWAIPLAPVASNTLQGVFGELVAGLIGIARETRAGGRILIRNASAMQVSTVTPPRCDRPTGHR